MAEHGRGRGRHADPAGGDRRPGRGGRRGHRRGRGQDRDAGLRSRRSRRWSGRSTCVGGVAGRARPGDGRRERRASCSSPTPARRSSRCCRGRRSSRRTSTEARALRRDGGRTAAADAPEDLARAVHALGPRIVVVTGGHGARRRGDRPVLRRRAGRADRRPRVTRAAPRTARAARTRRRWPRSSRSGLEPLEAARAAKRIASEAVRDGLREIGAGAGPGRRARPAPPAAPRPDCARAIIRPMKFLRLMPGKGEVVLAEGDPQLSEDEERLVEEFRRQLDSGMWAAVPITEGVTGRREAIMVQDFAEIPHGHRARDLLPARGGRLTRPRRCRVGRRVRRHWRWWRSRSAPTSASAELRGARAQRRPRPRPRAAGASQRFDPGIERRAERRARALLRSIVNPEEWEMYRDLGFIRVLGQARPARPRGRRAGLRLPDLSAQADRRLPAGLEQPAERVLRRVPRPQRARSTGPSCPTPTTCSPSG